MYKNLLCICHAARMEEGPKATLDIQCLWRGGGVALTSCEGPGTSGRAGAPSRPHRPSSILGDVGPCGYRWPPSETNAADEPC